MLSALKVEGGKRLTKRLDIGRGVQEFYTSLFTWKTIVPLEEGHREEEDAPLILVSEVQATVQSFKIDKAARSR